MRVEHVFDPRTWTLTYVVWDEHTRDAVIIDPVLDYDPNRVAVYEETNGQVADIVQRHALQVRWILETHAHADHLSGSQGLKRRFEAKVGISERIVEVQRYFAGSFDLDIPTDGSQFDHLVKDGEVLEAGALRVEAVATPGHTPACVTWHIGDALFTGDTLFMPDYGTGRCDFPRGSAADLYDSVQRLYERFPDETRVFVGHDYQPGGRPLMCETTIGESKRHNRQLRIETPRHDFVAFRNERDRSLSLPALLFPSIQVNIDAGRLPPPGRNGRRYLKLPITVMG